LHKQVFATSLCRVKRWRQLAVRGAAGSKFRNDVASAYDYRCIFTGQRLPRLEVTGSAGVDCAHILPWSNHNINSVRNGLCLRKQCHWAFDEGVLSLTFDEGSNTYLVEFLNEVRKAAKEASFNADYFEALTGPVPVSHLPKNKALWPFPKYIEELHRFMLTT
jgi:HNH endonuclease